MHVIAGYTKTKEQIMIQKTVKNKKHVCKKIFFLYKITYFLYDYNIFIVKRVLCSK